MTRRAEVVSVLVALQFVVSAVVVLVVAPLEVAAPLVPLLVVFAAALLLRYRS